ncbi:hypothetical protein K38_086 [Salmonella phage Kenya-K38]|nr:hypothetical protein K38_086 [Salmonella phage Kenya-K38]
MINPKVANAYIKYKEGTASKEQLKLLLDVIAQTFHYMELHALNSDEDCQLVIRYDGVGQEEEWPDYLAEEIDSIECDESLTAEETAQKVQRALDDYYKTKPKRGATCSIETLSPCGEDIQEVTEWFSEFKEYTHYFSEPAFLSLLALPRMYKPADSEPSHWPEDTYEGE